MIRRLLSSLAALALLSVPAFAQAGERWICATKESLVTSTGKSGKATGMLEFLFEPTGNDLLVIWRSQRGGIHGIQEATWTAPDPEKPRALRIHVQFTGGWFDETEAWLESLYNFDPSVTHFSKGDMFIDLDISKSAAKLALSHVYEWRDKTLATYTMRLSMKGKGRQLVTI